MPLWAGAGRVSVPSVISRSVHREGRAIRIGARSGQRQVLKKGIRNLLARRALIVVADQVFRNGCWNRRMLKHVVDHQPLLYPGRDQKGRHPDAEAVEMEWIGRAGGAGL